MFTDKVNGSITWGGKRKRGNVNKKIELSQHENLRKLL